ncbi:MAG: hypothetical protein LBR53_00960 [Deltaproteobacteria bacterium]|jgi:hypothetical protein|nr:hypothetical protein [Deltaproteobacteria bacterium]
MYSTDFPEAADASKPRDVKRENVSSILLTDAFPKMVPKDGRGRETFDSIIRENEKIDPPPYEIFPKKQLEPRPRRPLTVSCDIDSDILIEKCDFHMNILENVHRFHAEIKGTLNSAEKSGGWFIRGVFHIEDRIAAEKQEMLNAPEHPAGWSGAFNGRGREKTFQTESGAAPANGRSSPTTNASGDPVRTMGLYEAAFTVIKDGDAAEDIPLDFPSEPEITIQVEDPENFPAIRSSKATENQASRPLSDEDREQVDPSGEPEALPENHEASDPFRGYGVPPTPPDTRDPLKASDPVKAVDPEAQVKPIDPENPLNPGDPTNPADPFEPVAPFGPPYPFEPFESIDPSDPFVPFAPIDPMKTEESETLASLFSENDAKDAFPTWPEKFQAFEFKIVSSNAGDDVLGMKEEDPAKLHRTAAKEPSGRADSGLDFNNAGPGASEGFFDASLNEPAEGSVEAMADPESRKAGENPKRPGALRRFLKRTRRLLCGAGVEPETARALPAEERGGGLPAWAAEEESGTEVGKEKMEPEERFHPERSAPALALPAGENRRTEQAAGLLEGEKREKESPRHLNVEESPAEPDKSALSEGGNNEKGNASPLPPIENEIPKEPDNRQRKLPPPVMAFTDAGKWKLALPESAEAEKRGTRVPSPASQPPKTTSEREKAIPPRGKGGPPVPGTKITSPEESAKRRGRFLRRNAALARSRVGQYGGRRALILFTGGKSAFARERKRTEPQRMEELLSGVSRLEAEGKDIRLAPRRGSPSGLRAFKPRPGAEEARARKNAPKTPLFATWGDPFTGTTASPKERK